MRTLERKVIVVSGGGGEIGAALCRGLAVRGAEVVVADIDLAKAERVADDIVATGGRALPIQLDVIAESGWENAMAFAAKSFGPLDVLVNCAGLFATESYAFADMPLEEWQTLHQVNLEGTFLGVKHGIRAMSAAGGSIINIGSVVGFFGARSGAAYGTSKGALRALTTQAAASCISTGVDVRVNVVHPGYVLTDSALGNAIEKTGSRESAENDFALRSPRKRVMRPEDLIGIVAFLAADESRMMNGAEILIDDGLSTQMPGVAFTNVG